MYVFCHSSMRNIYMVRLDSIAMLSLNLKAIIYSMCLWYIPELFNYGLHYIFTCHACNENSLNHSFPCCHLLKLDQLLALISHVVLQSSQKKTALFNFPLLEDFVKTMEVSCNLNYIIH
jgi:hypothetical protein